ncbi:MAG: DUF4173 domain-containing protein [Defluviitaleaceae bacterium]|nr:DUF4173 domain-containing protein [Defluviitaleaceae bacterium]
MSENNASTAIFWPDYEKAPVEEVKVDPAVKRNLLLYLVLTVAGLVLLVLPRQAGFSLPLFVLLQAGLLYYILPRRKELLMLIPIFILALNSFISANPMWRGVNLVVWLALYGMMFMWMANGFSFCGRAFVLLVRTVETILNACAKLTVPFKWGAAAKPSSMPLVRRVLIGVGLSIPMLVFVVIMLSSADWIFSQLVTGFLNRILNLIQINILGRVIFGGLIGLYLFGLLYGILVKPSSQPMAVTEWQFKGDSMVLGIMLTSVLLVYTLFVAIQFRYLFAAADDLPYGLNFVTYARRGFFELLLLTFVNIGFILITVWLTAGQAGRGAKITKFLCMYLCAITVVLLVSSFYRMWLYSSDDGLTRLRLLVFGFLIFEAIGLLFTFIYIIRPKFNVVLVYGLIALSYFLLLNLTPIDRIIARDQINRYFETGRGGIAYTLTLSPDAAPEITRLLSAESPQTRQQARNYFARLNDNGSWR